MRSAAARSVSLLFRLSQNSSVDSSDCNSYAVLRSLAGDASSAESSASCAEFSAGEGEAFGESIDQPGAGADVEADCMDEAPLALEAEGLHGQIAANGVNGGGDDSDGPSQAEVACSRCTYLNPASRSVCREQILFFSSWILSLFAFPCSAVCEICHCSILAPTPARVNPPPAVAVSPPDGHASGEDDDGDEVGRSVLSFHRLG